MAEAQTVEAEVHMSGLGNDVRSPFFDESGRLHFVSQQSGDICCCDDTEGVLQLCNTGGQPNGAVLDGSGVVLVADLALAAVVRVSSDGDVKPLVRFYENSPLKGPNTLAMDRTGTLFFTDSGPFGDTGLMNKKGSLFVITAGQGGHMLKPIALECLAYPTGLALSPNGRFIYVAEMMENRVLRFFQQPEGVFHVSTFYQFSGRVGPSALAVDGSGRLYVGLYEVSAGDATGVVSVLSPDGVEEYRISVPGPEITGLVVSSDSKHLYITEASTGSLYHADLA